METHTNHYFVEEYQENILYLEIYLSERDVFMTFES
jgi:hypothetical protein